MYRLLFLFIFMLTSFGLHAGTSEIEKKKEEETTFIEVKLGKIWSDSRILSTRKIVSCALRLCALFGLANGAYRALTWTSGRSDTPRDQSLGDFAVRRILDSAILLLLSEFFAVQKKVADKDIEVV